MSLDNKILIFKVLIIVSLNWILCFGFKFETKFVSLYINGLFKTYMLDQK